MERKNRIMELEALRGFAAFYVAASHVALNVMPPGPWRAPFKFGQEAVMLFFFLSGAVIHLTHRTRPTDFKGFMRRRFQRIYFPLFVAIAVTTAVKWLSGHMDDFSLGELVGNLLMVQDVDTKPGTIVDPYMSNLPLWSLSYEWVFYLLYIPLLRVLPGGWRRLTAVLFGSVVAWCAYMAAPDHFFLVAAYLVIWWAGVELADRWLVTQAVRPLDWVRVGAMLAPMAVLATIPVFQQRNSLQFGYYPLLTFRHFAVAALMPLAGAVWLAFGLRGFRWTLGPFAALAPISYAVYVLHFPILLGFVDHGAWTLAISIPALIGAAYVTERLLQPSFNRALGAITARLRRPAARPAVVG